MRGGAEVGIGRGSGVVVGGIRLRILRVAGVVVAGIGVDSVGDFSALSIGVGHCRRHVLTATDRIDAGNGFLRHRELGPSVSDKFFARGKRHEPVTALDIAGRSETDTA